MTENNGYVSYLEQRLALLEKELQKQGVIATPENNLLFRLTQLSVGTVITWSHKYPRNDIYKFVAYQQKFNEWHIVSGNTKRILTDQEMISEYSHRSLESFKVLS